MQTKGVKIQHKFPRRHNLNGVVTAIIAILVFGFLIFIHEFGHYITARIFKVSITEFSIGMGPKLLWYDSKKTGIRYSLAILPIGGFVAMVGEDEDSDDPNAFNKKPAWQRLIITAAGATVNILAGFIAMIILVSCIKIGNTTYAEPMDESVLKNDLGYTYIDTSLRSSDSGLMFGDEIIRVNGKRVRIYDELSYEIMRFGNEPVDLTVIRNGEELLIEDVTFPKVTEQSQTFGAIDFKITGLKEKNIFSVIGLSFRKTCLVMRMCWESIFDLITGRYSVAAISGPVGISSAIGDAARAGFLSLLNITVLISINLGFMNLLPVPALDGGRIVLILVEMITKKKLPAKVEGMINGIALMILLLLSLIIMFKDIFVLL